MPQVDEYGFELVGWSTAPYFIGQNGELWECPECRAVVFARGRSGHSIFHDNIHGYQED